VIALKKNTSLRSLIPASLFAISLFAISLLVAPYATAQTTSQPASAAVANASAALPPLAPITLHYVDVTVRNHFNIPPEMEIVIGNPTPGDIPGFNNLPIIVMNNGKPAGKVTMMISADHKTLLGIVRFDVSRDFDTVIPIAGRPVRGNANATVKVIVFDDLQCPYCAMMHSHMFPALSTRYKDTVAFYYKDFPLSEIHPWAMHAAVDVNCIAKLNTPQSGIAYWDLVDYIHAHAREIAAPPPAPATTKPDAPKDPNAKPADAKPVVVTPGAVKPETQIIFDRLDRLTNDEALRNKLDTKAVAACVHDQDQADVDTEVKLADTLGLNATPTLYVDGEKMDGVVDIDILTNSIDRALLAHGVTPPAKPPTAVAGPASQESPAKP